MTLIWHINIELGKFTGNIFIDLKKAFDTVDHAILIQKLSKYGIQGNKLSLNVIKTQAMVIGSRPNLKKIGENTVDSPAFVIDDSAVELVDSIKYLGAKLTNTSCGTSKLNLFKPKSPAR